MILVSRHHVTFCTEVVSHLIDGFHISLFLRIESGEPGG
jgi:hypothetical protein